MQTHNLKRNNPNKTSIRVGRGGKRGKTSGKGHKGQKARAGNSSRPEIRDMIKRLPKLRGYRFKSFRPDYTPINVVKLDIAFKDGDKVNPLSLIKKGLLSKKKGRIPKVKILAQGEISKKLTFSKVSFSQTAKEKIEKAGGKIE
jgi:large subunit ribosomal protein L15